METTGHGSGDSTTGRAADDGAKGRREGDAGYSGFGGFEAPS